MRKWLSFIPLFSIVLLSSCTKSGSQDPVVHDSSYVDLISSVSFYGPNGKFIMDSLSYTQTGMPVKVLMYSGNMNSPLEEYSFSVDSNHQRILSYEYRIHDNNLERLTKFNVEYNDQGKISGMTPVAGGDLGVQEYQVHFTYDQDKIMFNPFGVSGLTDTLVYDHGNLKHRQQYGSNATTHVSIPAMEDYFYSTHPNPFYNAALENSSVLFMKCPADGAGREFDYLADVNSKNLPDSVYTLIGDNQVKLSWGKQYYTWITDGSGKVTSGDLIIMDTAKSGMTGLPDPFTLQYHFEYNYKKQLIIK